MISVLADDRYSSGVTSKTHRLDDGGERKQILADESDHEVIVVAIEAVAREADVLREDFLDVAAVALRAVGNENLVRFDLAAARRVVVLRDRFAEKGVALLGAVALEGLALGHLVDERVEGMPREIERGDERGER